MAIDLSDLDDATLDSMRITIITEQENRARVADLPGVLESVVRAARSAGVAESAVRDAVDAALADTVAAAAGAPAAETEGGAA